MHLTYIHTHTHERDHMTYPQYAPDLHTHTREITWPTHRMHLTYIRTRERSHDLCTWLTYTHTHTREITWPMHLTYIHTHTHTHTRERSHDLCTWLTHTHTHTREITWPMHLTYIHTRKRSRDLPIVCSVLFEPDLNELSKPTAVIVSKCPRVSKCLRRTKSQLTHTLVLFRQKVLYHVRKMFYVPSLNSRGQGI